jgi:hypothetical protein
MREVLKLEDQVIASPALPGKTPRKFAKLKAASNFAGGLFGGCSSSPCGLHRPGETRHV